MAANNVMGRRTIAQLTGGVLVLLGLVLGLGGLWLLALGGSSYYVIAGAGLLICGVLLIDGNQAALFVYALLLLVTLGWAVHEVGFNWWPLAARGDLLFPLGIWLLTPWVTRGLGGGFFSSSTVFGKTGLLWLAVVVAVMVLGISLTSRYDDIAGRIETASASVVPQSEDVSAHQPDEDWRDYGRGAAGQRYSPLAQITRDNVATLKVAWTFHTGDLPGPNDPVESTFEVTPLKVGDTLFLCSLHQKLMAVDARTGTLRWSYDPQLYVNPTFQHLTCRGVAYHETAADAVNADGSPAPTDCPRAVFLPVNDGRMISVNADTGMPCESFANHGTLNLQAGMGIITSGFYEPTSPPVVSDKILVVAGSVIDNYSNEVPSGVVRGFDIHTGKLVWAWDSGAADENALPSATYHYKNASPNAWAPLAYDPALGLVFLPMGVHAPDIWGGNRSAEDDRYSSALVALNIENGKRAWSYQTVHHDLWDMDVPAQPTLIDIAGKDGVVPVVMVPTKTGNLFVLDRRTGSLVVPAKERPVPQGAAPGDHVAPTQPFSDLTFRPEAVLSGADMWGATIFDQLACRIMFHRMRYEGTFTPPSLQGTLVFPGNLGMFEWGGIAVDPVRQIAIANPIAIPFVSKLVPRGPGNPSSPDEVRPSGTEKGLQYMFGAPYGVMLHPFLSPVGLPCKQPPWGFMAGIDLRTMTIAWMHRNGTIRDVAPLPVPIKMGVPSLGGPLTTAGGVAFLTSTQDYYIRAYDVTDGSQIWEDRLPAGGQSTPMSYAVDGQQYVVTAAGGHGSFGTKQGDFIIAYSLGGPVAKVAQKQ